MSNAIEKAKSALERAKGNPEKARAILLGWAGEKTLRAELLDLGVSQAISSALTMLRAAAITAGVCRPDRLISEGGIGNVGRTRLIWTHK